MPRKVKIKVSELIDLEVGFLSLVDRGANRVPFRIMKDDTKERSGMSLRNLFLKKSAIVPEVVAIVIAGAVSKQKAEAIVTGSGFKIEDYKFEEDMHVFRQKTKADGEDRTVVQVSENVALVAINCRKGLDSYPGATSFSENMGSAGFYPGMRLGMDMLCETICSIMCKATTREAAAGAVSTALSEFSGYIGGLVEALPSEAFAMEHFLMAERKKAESLVDGPDAPETPAADETTAPPETTAAETAPETPAGVEAAATETPEATTPPTPDTPAETPAITASTDTSEDEVPATPETPAVETAPPAAAQSEDANESLIARLTAVFDTKVTELREGFQSKLDAITAGFETRDAQIATVMKSVGSLEKTLTGKVTVTMPTEDSAEEIERRKAEAQAAAAPPLMDTGMLSRAARSKAAGAQEIPRYRM